MSITQATGIGASGWREAVGRYLLVLLVAAAKAKQQLQR